METDRLFIYEHVWFALINSVLLHAPVALVVTSLIVIAVKVGQLSCSRQAVGGDAQWKLVASISLSATVILTLSLLSTCLNILVQVYDVSTLEQQVRVMFFDELSKLLHCLLWSINLPLFVATSSLLRHELVLQVRSRCCRQVAQTDGNDVTSANEAEELMRKRSDTSPTQEVTQV